MKLAALKYEESVALEFTGEELYIINWALSDYMLLLQHSLFHNVLASPIILEDHAFDSLDVEKRKELTKSLELSHNMKTIMELLVY